MSVLAVSHGGACVQFSRHWIKHQKCDFTRGFKNCGIMRFEYQDGIFSLIEVIVLQNPA